MKVKKMEAVKRLRKQCGLTQEQLAVQMGVSGPLINHYERGKNQITPANAWRLVEVCRRYKVKTSLDEIYGEVKVSA